MTRSPTPIFAKVSAALRRAITRHDLLPASSRLLVAVSGGQDSLALAETLSRLRGAHAWPQLALVHCDHRWPGDEGIAAHVKRYAGARRLPLHVIDAADTPAPTSAHDAGGGARIGADATAQPLSVPLSEAAARDWRYASISALARARGFDAVVTAHTRTDLAETVLFNLAHGAGSDGLSALTWTRALCGGVRLVRPLLDVARRDTGALCAELGLAVWDDAYNHDARYARNRVRRTVMPALAAALNPRVEEALARSAHLLRDEAAHLRDAGAAAFGRVVRCDGDAGRAWVDRGRLRAESVAVQRRVLRQTLETALGLTYRAATFAQVEAVRELLDRAVGSAAPSLFGDGSAVVVDEQTIEVRARRRERGGHGDVDVGDKESRVLKGSDSF